jgi:hypothetical protein
LAEGAAFAATLGAPASLGESSEHRATITWAGESLASDRLMLNQHEA